MSRPAKLTMAQRLDAIRRYLAGETVRAIARRIGSVTHGAVCSLIRRMGIKRAVPTPPAQSRPVRPEQEAPVMPSIYRRWLDHYAAAHAAPS